MAEAQRAPLEVVGGKAASLARLRAAGIPVPPFFVVTAETLERVPEGAAVPPGVAGPVLQAYRDLGRSVVAVRSSGAGEDSASASFAGQFASVLGVSGGDRLIEALSQVWRSAFSADAAAYRHSRGLAAGGFAVVVQAQVFPDKAGVLFTRHPLEPEEGLAYLEANFGTGESVVGGIVTPDSLTLNRGDCRVVSSAIGTKRVTTVVDESGSRVVPTPPERRRLAVLSNQEAEEIVAMGLRIEQLFGAPQDIEWAVDGSGLWILQARPQTGLGR